MNDDLMRFNEIYFKDNVLITDSLSKFTYKMNSTKYHKYGENVIKEKLKKSFDKYIDEEDNNIHTVYFMVTNNCNLNCPFCSAKANSEKSEKIDMSFIKNEIIPKFKELNVGNIVISGGEPLIVKNLVELIELLKSSLDINITLQTNGVIINEELSNRLKGKIDSIDFSIQYYFQTLEKNEQLEQSIVYLKNITDNLGLSFVIDKNNQKFVYKILDLCNKYDLMMSLKFVDPVGDAIINNIDIMTGEEKIKIYEQIVDYIIEKEYFNDKIMNNFKAHILCNRSCGACNNLLAIKPSGKMYVCYGLMEDEFLIDNIVNLSGEMIKERFIKKDFKFDYNKYFERDSYYKCNECKLKYICSGMCGSNRYYNNSSLDDCDFVKLILLYSAFYYDMNKNMKENLIAFKECINDKCYLEF